MTDHQNSDTASRNSKSIRAALYSRVSTVGHGQDPETQLLPLREVAEQRGWTVTEYVDAGISGSTDTRPALDRLMADARAGRISVVAVARFDRFARSVSHLVSALDEFKVLGVDFVSISESIDTSSAMGRMVFTIIAAVAELEREIIRERVVAGVRRAQASGTHCGRPKVELDLRPALAMLREGHGLKAISRALGISRATLRRRLTEAGEWPRREGVHNPATSAAA